LEVAHTVDQVQNDLDRLCINTIRMLSADTVEKAQSGHPGMPLGAAAMTYVLWTRFLRYNPGRPDWVNRDRFVLSAGHGSALLYSLLHLTGYDLSLEDIKKFRQWGSKTPGHPEFGHTPGVEATTGPLGQGLANGVGMAVSERFLAARFNRPGYPIVDHFTCVIAGDGDLMEGVSHEAASLAGHLKLGKLVCLYDDNRVSIEGSTDLAYSEDSAARFEAYGWHVERVGDGNDVNTLAGAIQAAREETERPSILLVRTHIGFGSPGKQDSAAAHGEPLGPEEIIRTKERLGWPREPEFFIPDQALAHFRRAVEQGKAWEAEWDALFQAYTRDYPDEAAEFSRWRDGLLPAGWDRDCPVFPADPEGMATRAASGTVLNAIARNLPNLLGGSADLAPSTKTVIKEAGDFGSGSHSGRNFHFGVREHGMGALLNGMAYHGGLIPFGATFLVFSDYMRPPIRLAAMVGLKVIYIFTHDSIGLGEDGPTHQPVEHLAALRAIPGLTVIRPADANETVEAWRCAIRESGPVALILTRQSVPTLDRDRNSHAGGLSRGAYTLYEAADAKPQAILIASGSEVHLALEAAVILKGEGVSARVVSMPSWELFEKQPAEYRNRVLPADINIRVAVEAGSTQGWHRYTGDRGEVIGLDRFGASAPDRELFENFGFTAREIARKVAGLLK
jgi:transketolase